MSINGVCETCYDTGYVVEVHKDEKTKEWNGKTIPCPHCEIAKQL